VSVSQSFGILTYGKLSCQSQPTNILSLFPSLRGTESSIKSPTVPN
jgi:hypothetical protein